MAAPIRRRPPRFPFLVCVAALVLSAPAGAGWVSYGNGYSEKWDDPTHGTGATVTWGFMAHGTTVDPSVPIAAEVQGGSDLAAMRGAYDAAYGVGAFDAAIERALATWSEAANIEFVGPIADPGLPSGAAGATSPDIRIGAFQPVQGTGFEGLGAVGYGPPFDDLGFPDAQAGDIYFNLSIPAIQPAGAEGAPIVGIGNDLENLALHELGHAAMGLGHPAQGIGDVMFVGFECCLLINRELSPDDVTGARSVYGAPICDDGLDNDADGLTDLADPGCDGPGDSSEQSAALVCDDGLDNDSDGMVDTSDPGCRDASYAQEDPECQDGLDNDGQIGTDFDGGESVLGVGNGDPNGADPQCTVAWRNKEAQVNTGGCGLGPEVAALLLGFGLVARRRGARPAGRLARSFRASR